MNDPKVIANYIQCLSKLESNTSSLYQVISEKADMPIVKTLFLNISQDSAKHSSLLEGIADNMRAANNNPKDCAKKLGSVWQTIDTFQREISARKKIGKPEFAQLTEKLTFFESTMGEEYYVFVQMKTLQLMTKEINQLYNIDLQDLRELFESIIRDEEHHRELLATIKKHITDNDKKPRDNTPKVKFQNPDAWIRSLPPTA